MNKLPTVLGLVALILLSGCLGLTSYESPTPVVQDSSLDDTSYELSNESDIVLNRSVGGATNIKVISKLNRYEKVNNENTSIPLPNSQYVALSTPSVSPLGVELNPIVLDPTGTTFERVQGQVGGSIQLGEKVDTINTTHSDGGNITVDKYEGTISVQDVSAQFDATILTAVLERDRAVVVTLAAYPQSSDDNQQNKALELIENTRVSQSSQ